MPRKGSHVHYVPLLSLLTCCRFTRSEVERFVTSVSVREALEGEWKYLSPSEKCGFLTFTPNLFNSEPTKTCPPEDKDDVWKAVQAAEVRIADSAKFRELLSLLQHLYQERIEPFHWNKQTSPEAIGRHWPDQIPEGNY